MPKQLITISWPGNKRLMAPLIIERMPGHRTYVEPFGGSLAVLMRKEPSRCDVVNDIDGDLIRFYWVVKYHIDELFLELRWVLYSREEFQSYRAQPGFTDIQRAARWFLCNKMSFGGMGEHFGSNKTTGAPSRQNLLYRLEALSERLDRVIIEHLDWREVLTRYDSPETCFFCDPPYTTGTQAVYSVRWCEDEHVALRDLLLNLKGTFILTYDDSPLVRELYAGCQLHPVSQQTGINNRSGKKSRRLNQLIITPQSSTT